jgi:tRNA pseudouridine38-40 synthase
MMSLIRNYKIVLAYDGAGFMGWQIQPCVRTVQQSLAAALQEILGHPVRIIASGRTDAGVHALGQVVNFHTASSIPTDGLLRGLNSVLPSDVCVLSVREVSPDFHARYMARSKRYVYVIDTAAVRSPFLDRYAFHVRAQLDISAMSESARYLLGEHDFTSFLAAGSEVKTTVRTITVSEVITKGNKVFFYIQGGGFLRHMVRNIVGTLLLVGRRKLLPEDMKRIIALKDRSCAGPTAPPQGLYLIGVEY